ncbi:MAG TPA: tetratricopeptide repeat protein [Pyrinomonadaceae bacterium]|jgi:tetratricopeptide (TPR) repeat protein|nr:tetratricopeptide repeat protein [Pyrinomonadaceae bacterium]
MLDCFALFLFPAGYYFCHLSYCRNRAARFRFTGLTPSQYTITIRVPGYIEERQTVELLTSPSANLQFQLRSNGASRAANIRTAVTNANVPSEALAEFEKAEATLATNKKKGLTECLRHLEKALVIYPNFLEAKLQLGAVQVDLNLWDQAEQTLKKALEIDPKVANGYFALVISIFIKKTTVKLKMFRSRAWQSRRILQELI